jgi:hypothetical protein
MLNRLNVTSSSNLGPADSASPALLLDTSRGTLIPPVVGVALGTLGSARSVAVR